MPRRLIIDPEQLALDRPLVSPDEIRRLNPQRYEMEQLTAIVYIDPTEHVIAGYKMWAKTSIGCAATCLIIRSCPAC